MQEQVRQKDTSVREKELFTAGEGHYKLLCSLAKIKPERAKTVWQRANVKKQEMPTVHNIEHHRPKS